MPRPVDELRWPGIIEVSEAEYRKQRKAYEAMLAALKAYEPAHAAAWNEAKWLTQAVAAIKLAEDD